MQLAAEHAEELEAVIRLSVRIKQLEAEIGKKGDQDVSVQDECGHQGQDTDTE